MSKAIITLSILGALGLISGIALLASFSPLFDFILEKQLVVKNGSYSYGMWTELPEDLEMYMKLYYFNVTNFEEIMNRPNNTKGPKPNLQEVGPYIFRERHYKEVKEWDDENGEVIFQQRKRWQFIPEESRGLEDDLIVNVNIIALAAMEYARYKENPFYINAINDLMSDTKTEMFMQYKATNWTFDGIVDDLLEAALSSSFLDLPIPFDKFGWFYSRNDSAEYDGTFGMYTGASGIDKVGQISSWNGLRHINETIYPQPCGDLTGSAGEFFPPGRGQDYVDFFAPDLCRSIRFDFEGKTNVDGAKGYKYALTERLVQNSSYNSPNSCYNPEPVADQPLINGLLNVSACKFQAPAYISYPHFYLADDMLLKQLHDGSLSPSKEKHQSYLSLDPKSGIPLEVAVRLQINGLARPLNREVNNGSNWVKIDAFEGLDPTFYPMIWFETSTRINGNSETGSLVVLVTKIPAIMYGVGGSMVAIGVVLLAIAFYKRSR